MDIKKLFKEKIVLLDGAFGTQLQKRGLAGGAAPERLNIENPELVYAVTKEYIEIGRASCRERVLAGV